jgi:hypothetical protein
MSDIFYIKTKDGTNIAVFDLEIKGNEIGYSWNAVEDNVKSEPYENEVEEILSEIITKQMLNMGDNT